MTEYNEDTAILKIIEELHHLSLLDPIKRRYLISAYIIGLADIIRRAKKDDIERVSSRVHFLIDAQAKKLLVRNKKKKPKKKPNKNK